MVSLFSLVLGLFSVVVGGCWFISLLVGGGRYFSGGDG